MFSPVLSKEEAEQFRDETEGIYFDSRITGGHERRVESHLRKFAISLTYETGSRKKAGVSDALLDALEQVMLLLPCSHLESDTFKELHLGGWGNGTAKGSEYDRGNVHIFDFALLGAKRNFYGLLLHEIGHSFYHKIRNEGRLDDVLACSVPIHKNGAILGIDFLNGANFRVGYQLVAEGAVNEENINEFVAETYLAYVTQGPRLREFISSLPKEPQRAWRTFLMVLKEEFEGRVYV